MYTKFYYSSSKFSKFIQGKSPLLQQLASVSLLKEKSKICPKRLMLSDVSLLAVSNVNKPVGLVCLPYVMWSAHFFVTHIQTQNISSWNDPTVLVCFMLARASTKTFVSRIHIRQPSPKNSKKIFVSRNIHQQSHSLAEV